MEEVLHGSIWYTIGRMLATDDVERLRVAASRWNRGDWYGPLGRVFFIMLTLERHKKLWHCDTDGDRVITSVRRRTPVMEGIRRDANCHGRCIYFTRMASGTLACLRTWVTHGIKGCP